MRFNARALRSESGLTLVELMVSTALFGISAFTMAILLAENSKRTLMAQNEARLSESLQEFSNSLDILLANTTRLSVSDCNCGTANCVLTTPMIDCKDGGCGTTTRECALNPGACPAGPAVFTFDIENSTAPIFPSMDPSLGECLPSPGSGGLIPRGCKKRIAVYLSLPEPMTIVTGDPASVPLPPVISIADITNPNRVKIISALHGVIEFSCGMTPADPNAAAPTPSYRQFFYRLKAKARRSNQNRSLDLNQLEGWHETDPNYHAGPRREISATLAFRNLYTYGVHFGKTQSDSSCHPDGGVSMYQPVANCCSGYWVGTSSGAGTGSTCLPVAKCVPRGVDPLNPGGDGIPATDVMPALACCSHRLTPDGTKCL